MQTYLVIWKDELGTPRAWGQSENEAQAEVEAFTQLQKCQHDRSVRIGSWTRETKKLVNGQPIQ